MLTTTHALRLLLLAVTPSLAGFGGCGPAVKQTACPVVPPLPQKLLNKTDYAEQARRELYEPASSPSPSATKPLIDTKPSDPDHD
ncbi:hypothetical protein FQJ89_20150 [Xanthomonas vasicola]|nr:hypothetical protein NX81_015695 [Xanthomonas vasicola]KGR38623.1 hypothetical protein NX04_19840 [Xanthomonas vasicola]TWQ34017.1 hypothetical protein FQJ96_20450 [Xanthomonas vasicola]TWQ53551.1 hypothetical protein FQJ93_20225 [Xanthomonas vasicola]TWQ72981.1 hypothetical protein FQJ89_20150 [Xanthomonas vasicola]